MFGNNSDDCVHFNMYNSDGSTLCGHLNIYFRGIGNWALTEGRTDSKNKHYVRHAFQSMHSLFGRNGWDDRQETVKSIMRRAAALHNEAESDWNNGRHNWKEYNKPIPEMTSTGNGVQFGG